MSGDGTRSKFGFPWHPMQCVWNVPMPVSVPAPRFAPAAGGACCVCAGACACATPEHASQAQNAMIASSTIPRSLHESRFPFTPPTRTALSSRTRSHFDRCEGSAVSFLSYLSLIPPHAEFKWYCNPDPTISIRRIFPSWILKASVTSRLDGRLKFFIDTSCPFVR